MFCSKCGAQVPDDAVFCPKCGKQLATVTTAAPEAPKAAPEVPKAAPAAAPAAEEPPKKKKGGFLVVLVVMAIAWVVGRFAGGAMADGFLSPTPTPKPMIIASSSEGSQEYRDVFAQRLIIFAPAVFYNAQYGILDSASYVSVDEDDFIDHLQYGYSGDTIVQMTETAYIPIAGASAADVQALDAELMAQYGSSGLDFVTVSSSSSSNYYALNLRIDDLDNEENVKAAIDAGLLLAEKDGGALSMYVTETNLLANGYIKK